MQPMYDQPISQLSAEMSVSAPVADPAHAGLTSSQMHCIAPGYPLQVGRMTSSSSSATFFSPLQACYSDEQEPLQKSVDMGHLYKASHSGKASICFKIQVCGPCDGLSVQSDGKEGASYLGGQAAYAANDGFSDAHQQHFNLQPQHQQQRRVSQCCPLSCIHRISCTPGVLPLGTPLIE